MNCRLQVFKQEFSNSPAKTYRFAVVDSSKAKNYPANFICMLPLKTVQVKGKSGNVFSELFGDRSLDFAMELLSDALKNESDGGVKTEIERRLRLLDPKQDSLVKCSVCKKSFQSKRSKRHGQYFCVDCLKKRYASKY